MVWESQTARRVYRVCVCAGHEEKKSRPTAFQQMPSEYRPRAKRSSRSAQHAASFLPQQFA